MKLAKYQKKRDFSKTSEPRGRVGKNLSTNLHFVVQKHAAKRLHYDFRLEMDGVLKSWAIPKGPSLNSKDKRLAVHVEDHPLEYQDFEGTIPEGEYGGGTVLLWDRGTWFPEGNANQGYRQGRLAFQLNGTKLKGNWLLVEMKGERSENGKNWLLMKVQDRYASSETDITKRDRSVVTARSMKEVATDADRVWHSNRAVSVKSSKKKQKINSLKEISKQDPLPNFIAPELATLVQSIPKNNDQDWIHEIKFDGYRAISLVQKGEAKILTRRNQNWTKYFPQIAKDLGKVSVKQAWFDGEIVKLQQNGLSDFQALQNSIKSGDKQGIYYYLFDLLYLNGADLRALPLKKRRSLLVTLMETFKEKSPSLRYSEALEGEHKDIFANACRIGLEGLISKEVHSPYQSGRSRYWLKTKCLKQQEFLIIGFTDPGGARRGFGALLLGIRDSKGMLRYAGRVGTGFTQASLKEVDHQLRQLETEQPSVDRKTVGSTRGVHWVRPELMAEVSFSEWTNDNVLRQPSFKGLREDKTSAEITREIPIELASKEKIKSLKFGIILTNPDKILYSEQGITKRDLADYYYRIAEWILPYLKQRPVSLVRCPEGSKKKCFFQKHISQEIPKGLQGFQIKEKGDNENQYVVVRNRTGLVSLAQMGVLEIHPWGARTDDIEHPDVMVFDLDPDPSVPWSRVVDGARLVYKALNELKLKSFVKTTGGKGLHVVIPLLRRHTWEEMKAFSKSFAEAIVGSDPKHYTRELSKAKRKGKVFLDYLRNGRGATAVAPYSTRAHASAPVATPLGWEELDMIGRSDQFNVLNIFERLKKIKQDPWKGFFRVQQMLPIGKL